MGSIAAYRSATDRLYRRSLGALQVNSNIFNEFIETTSEIKNPDNLLIAKIPETYKSLVDVLHSVYEQAINAHQAEVAIKKASLPATSAMSTYSPIPTGQKGMVLTEAINSNKDQIAEWAKTQKDIFEAQNRDWRKAFPSLCGKYTYILEILKDENLSWDDFLEFLKGSVSEPVDSKKTTLLYNLFCKFCEPSLLPEKNTQLIKYSQSILKDSVAKFEESEKGSETIDAIIDADSEDSQRGLITKLLTDYQSMIQTRIIHDGIMSLMGNTLTDAHLSGKPMKDLSVISIITASNQVNGTDAKVKFVSSGQDSGWDTRKKRKADAKTHIQPESKKFKHNPSPNPTPTTPKTTSSISTTTTTTSSNPPKPTVPQADWICGLCKKKGHRTVDCPSFSKEQIDAHMKNKRDHRKSGTGSNCMCFCSHISSINSIISIAAFQLKLGVKVIIIANFINNNILIPIRIWVDTGSTISLLSSSSNLTNLVVPIKLLKPVVALGIGGAETLKKACTDSKESLYL